MKRLLLVPLAVALGVCELIRDGYAYPIFTQVASVILPRRPETDNYEADVMA